MENKFTKLGDLVDSQFTITSCGRFSWKKWDNENKKMLTSDKWAEGYAKKYQIDTDKGRLDLGSGQLSSLLEAVYYAGKADINGKTFSVKSNGKTGMDIRYYFNVANNTEGEGFNKFVEAKEQLKKDLETKVTDEDAEFLRSIPF